MSSIDQDYVCHLSNIWISSTFTSPNCIRIGTGL